MRYYCFYGDIIISSATVPDMSSEHFLIELIEVISLVHKGVYYGILKLQTNLSLICSHQSFSEMYNHLYNF